MTRTTLIAATAALAAAATPLVAVAPAGAAPQAKPAPTTLCSFQYANPNLGVVRGSSTASATQLGRGTVSLRLTTDAMSVLGYTQDVNVTWANLDTGKSGNASAKARVVGPSNEIPIPRVTTGKGRVTFVIGASNTSSINPQSMSNGDCSAELRVR